MNATLVTACVLSGLALGLADQAGAHPCNFTDLPASEGAVTVIASGDTKALTRELAKAAPGTEIVLSPGTYRLQRRKSLTVKSPGVTLTGFAGKRGDTVIEGGYKNLVINARDVTVKHLTLRGAATHAIQVRGEKGATGAVIYDVHAVDSGQQLIKVSTGDGLSGKHADSGVVACSLIEYTTVAPADYTNGIDILAANGWRVQDNELRRIRSARGPAGPAILVWKNAADTLITGNLIVDSWRGIAVGLNKANARSRGGAGAPTDHLGGVVANNAILALTEPADAAIEANYANGIRIVNNTVYYHPALDHAVPWSISYRFPSTRATIANNLVNRPIFERRPKPDGPAKLLANIEDADQRWFRDIFAADFHLVSDAAAVDAGVMVPGLELATDIDGEPRKKAAAVDVGADES